MMASDSVEFGWTFNLIKVVKNAILIIETGFGIVLINDFNW